MTTSGAAIQYNGPWFPSQVLKRVDVGHHYLLLTLSKPDGYQNSAGQYTLIEWSHAPGLPIRPYSIASRPEFPHLEFCLVRGAHDSGMGPVLDALQIGTTLQIGKPTGNLSWPDPYGPVIFVAGGSGIAPIHSLLQHHLATHGRCPVPSILVFGLRDGSAIPYGSEWHNWAADPTTRFRYTIAAEQPVGQNQIKGRVTDALVQEISRGAHYLLCGPPPMVDACVQLLQNHNVPPSHIHIESY